MALPRAASAVATLALSKPLMASAFVPGASPAKENSVAPSHTKLRGASGADLDGATLMSSGATLSVGCAVVLVAARGVARRQQRGGLSARHVYGKADSYKDYSDPWLAGADLGFDPLNLAVGTGTFDTGAAAVAETTYYNYRESEVKHGRFAMGAFLAIFAEEADRNALLKQLGNRDAVDNLDGTLGLDEVQLPVLLTGLGIQALAEYNLQKSEGDGDFLSVEADFRRCPGDLGFDPLGFQARAGGDLISLHNTEVNLGRLAMIGVTSFLYKEFLIKDPELASKIL